LMTKTTPRPVITASHISVKLKHLFVFWVKTIFKYLITNCFDPNMSSILIIMMENITILTMKTYHFPRTNYNTSSDLCLKKVFADQSETKVNLFEVIGF
jgi:hypothetical protein